MAKRGNPRVWPSMAGLFTIAFALGGWRAGLSRLSDNSFFWHLRTGRLILDSGLPRTDPYSFSASGTDWVGQSWLADLFYGVIDLLGRAEPPRRSSGAERGVYRAVGIGASVYARWP